MQLKLSLKVLPALLFALAVLPIHAQVHQAAEQGGLSGIPVVVGLGGADMSIDWGPGRRMEGITAWAEVFPFGASAVKGLGIELEGRDLNFNRPPGIPKMRQDTAVIGPMYSFTNFKNVRPYGKYLLGIGSIDFPGTTYTHDTFLVMEPGTGVDFRLYKHLWARAEYDYQFWHHTFGNNDLNPNGVSFGFLYDLRPTSSK